MSKDNTISLTFQFDPDHPNAQAVWDAVASMLVALHGHEKAKEMIASLQAKLDGAIASGKRTVTVSARGRA